MTQNNEYDYSGMIINGFLMLVLMFVAVPAIILGGFAIGIYSEAVLLGIAAIAIFAYCFLGVGFFIQQPNMARVMVFFGKYQGTFRGVGFYWCNPFMNRVVRRSASAIWISSQSRSTTRLVTRC